MNIEVIRYRLPVYWVGALINDDWTGLSDEEAQEVDDFVKHADGCPDRYEQLYGRSFVGKRKGRIRKR